MKYFRPYRPTSNYSNLFRQTYKWYSPFVNIHWERYELELTSEWMLEQYKLVELGSVTSVFAISSVAATAKEALTFISHFHLTRSSTDCRGSSECATCFEYLSKFNWYTLGFDQFRLKYCWTKTAPIGCHRLKMVSIEYWGWRHQLTLTFEGQNFLFLGREGRRATASMFHFLFYSLNLLLDLHVFLSSFMDSKIK